MLELELAENRPDGTDCFRPAKRLDEVILAEENLAAVEEIIREYHHEDRIRNYSLLIAGTCGEVPSPSLKPFQYILLFTRPNAHQIEQFLKMKLRGVRKDIPWSNTARRLEGLSYAEIEKVLERAVKRMIIGGEEILREYHFPCWRCASGTEEPPLK